LLFGHSFEGRKGDVSIDKLGGFRVNRALRRHRGLVGDSDPRVDRGPSLDL
jgi:hypothetical protein